MPRVARGERTRGNTRDGLATRAAASYTFGPPCPLTSELQCRRLKWTPKHGPLRPSAFVKGFDLSTPSDARPVDFCRDPIVEGLMRALLIGSPLARSPSASRSNR